MINISIVRFVGVLLYIGVMISCNKHSQEAGYAGQDLSTQAKIKIDKSSGLPVLDISYTGSWALYSGTSVETINFSTPVLEGNEPGVYAIKVEENIRHYFQLDTREGRAILAERHLPMRGGYNFRDMGGIRNKDGKYVQWGKVFRSDEMKDLTIEDVAYLNSIPLLTIVDFRSGKEIEEAPDVLPDSVRSHYIFSITPGNLSELSIQDITSLSTEQSVGIMEAVNRQFVTDPACIEQYKLFFSLLQNEENVPLLFHCTAGKDRTGMAGYLFLSSLDVEEKDILNDYLSSNLYLQDKYGTYIKEYPTLAPLLEVKPEYLKAGIQAIREQYGTVNDFLENYLMVDLKKMKELYLY